MGDNAEDAEAVSDDGSREEDFGIPPENHEVPKWIRPTVWAGTPMVLLALYVFALPVAIIFLEAKNMLSSNSQFETFLEVACSPLTWMAENLEFYERYIEWLISLFS